MTHLIRSRGNGGDHALWWRPNGAGYTDNVDAAGRYDEKPAQFMDEHHEWVEEEHALAASYRVASMWKLQGRQGP